MKNSSRTLKTLRGICKSVFLSLLIFFSVFFSVHSWAEENQEVLEEVSQEMQSSENREKDSLESLEKAFLISAGTDILSTNYILSSGIGYESNPVGFLGSTVAKVGIYLYAKNQEDTPEGQETAKKFYKASSAVFSGASANNVLVILGASTGVSVLIGLFTGFFVYF
jgi:hypothetical protein